MSRTFRQAIGLVVASGLIAMTAMPVTAQNEAYVRVVHASPDAPNVDVWVDGKTVLTDVPFTAISDYMALAAGTYNVQVTTTGTTDPVIDADLTLEAGTSYTVAATGLVADITATVLVDDRAPADGQSKLRVFHASPSAPAEVDVVVTDGPVLVEALAYAEATDYLAVDAGTYPLEIRAAGEDAAALSLEATLEPGENYTAIAMDDPDSEVGVQVIVATEAMGAMPNTSMSAPTTTWLALIGLALIAVSLVTALPLAIRRVRS
jgi:Tfp pilus assembly major pilin PilA